MNVRRAVPGDEETVRRLRLRALGDAPKAFEATLEEEIALGAEEWRRRLTNGATFLVEREGDPVGLVVGLPHAPDSGVAYLVSMWVAPEARGEGGGDSLVQAVLRWARDTGFTQVRLDVGKYNKPARRLYERNGFRPSGKEIVRQRDSLVELEMRCVVSDAG